MARKDDKRSAKGSKKEVRPGVWYIRVSAGYRRDGTQRKKRATIYGSEIDACAGIAQLADEMGVSLAIGDFMTLDVYFYQHFLPGRKATTTKANWKTYKHIYNAHIAGTFGNRDISTITNTDIQRWINRLPAQSAPHYARALRAIMNQAAFDHVIGESPMERYTFKMPRGRDTAPGDTWGANEVAACLDLLKDDRLFPLWLVMVGGGLSRSEALALDWSDISFSCATDIHGQQSWSAIINVYAACTAEDGMKETKNTRRRRVVPLRPLFANALHECAVEGPCVPICASYRGTRLSPHYIPKKWKELFEPGKPLADLPFVHIGRMRATFSTLMQQAGIDTTIINAMQGRSENSAVLYTNYLNPKLDTFSQSSGAMERLVSGE